MLPSHVLRASGSDEPLHSSPERAPKAGCCVWIGRNWNLVLPTVSLASGGGAVGVFFAGVTGPIAGILAAAAAAGVAASCAVMACQNARATAQEQLEKLDVELGKQKEVASALPVAVRDLREATVGIHGDVDALANLQTRAEASEQTNRSLTTQLQEATDKLARLEPLYAQLLQASITLTQQADGLEASHADQRRAAASLGMHVVGLQVDAVDLAQIHLDIGTATHAAAVKHQELGLNIEAFTALVRKLMIAHETLSSKSLALQQEIQQARALQVKNHQLAEQATKLSEDVADLEKKLDSFNGLDATSVQNILRFLQENEAAFQAFLKRTS